MSAPATDVLDEIPIRGVRASDGAPPDLVIEIPHGATRTADYHALARRLESPLPPSLSDFFHVNTDAGAPELAEAVARRFVAAEPTRSATILRSRIPRTFIDVNRRIDATKDELAAAKVTPGLMPWITAPADRALLASLHREYVEAVRAVAARSLPAGALLLLHTYAPRTVDVEVDLEIVNKLHHAYRPEILPTLPLRPEVDVIGRALDGRSLVPPGLLDALRERLATVGVTVADGETYPLHPSTIAWDHVAQWPGRVVCIEVRRDLVADPFDPFVEMTIGEAGVERIAGPMAEALRQLF